MEEIHTSTFWKVLAFVVVLMIAVALLAVATANGGPRREQGSRPHRCEQRNTHNGLWGNSCGRFHSIGGSSGVRG